MSNVVLNLRIFKHYSPMQQCKWNNAISISLSINLMLERIGYNNGIIFIAFTTNKLNVD